MKHTSLALLFLIILQACSSTSVKINIHTQHAVPPGSILILTKEIRIPDNKYGVYIQNGEIQSYSKVDQYYPHCQLVVRKSAGDFRLVKPGKFTVTRIHYEEMVSAPIPRIRLASISGPLGGGAGFEPYRTILHLESRTQPHVFSLECTHWELITEAEHLTRKQIEKALGSIFRIELPR